MASRSSPGSLHRPKRLADLCIRVEVHKVNDQKVKESCGVKVVSTEFLLADEFRGIDPNLLMPHHLAYDKFVSFVSRSFKIDFNWPNVQICYKIPSVVVGDGSPQEAIVNHRLPFINAIGVLKNATRCGAANHYLKFDIYVPSTSETPVKNNTRTPESSKLLAQDKSVKRDSTTPIPDELGSSPGKRVKFSKPA